MKIVIVGSGYVGLVTGACFAEFGFDVVCVDKDSLKIESLAKGIIPIYEPGLDSLVKQGIDCKRLQFTTDIKQAVSGADVVMIAVGTPSRRGDGHADLTHVFDAAKEISLAIANYTVVVTKSTVPVGTCRKVSEIIKKTRPDLIEGQDFNIASNPEFLREGSAITDFMRPDRVIVGFDNIKAKEILQKLYRPLFLIETPIVFTNIETSELIKYASNGFLALKISYINQMADLCEKTGGNVQELAKGLGLDKRIGSKFLNTGPGYGGSCFPKDTVALSQTAHEVGAPCSLVDAVIKYNDCRKIDMAKRIISALSKHTSTPWKVGILGITFKPNTDDLRDAPSLVIISELLQQGIQVKVYDPLFHTHSERLQNAYSTEKSLKMVEWASSAYDAVKDSACVVILTEWNEFRALDLQRVESLMEKSPGFKPLFMDFRNIYKQSDMGMFEYHSLGMSKN